MCDDGNREPARYAAEVLTLHRRLRFGRLAARLDDGDVAYRAVRPDGLLTIAGTSAALPERLLLGIQSFRLEQYLRLGWACREVVHRGALFCEPRQHLADDDVHVVTLDGDSGRILGYVGLVSSRDREPTAMDAPGRARFPVEVAHGVDLFDLVPVPADVTSHQVRELKRFVHDRSLDDRATRLRVTLELLVGAGASLLLTRPEARVFVGDVEESVALRHLLLAGLEVHVVEGTRPELPESDLMHLMYVRRAEVKPFVAEVPDAPELRRRVGLLQSVLAAPDVAGALGCVGREMPGLVRKVAA